ncbi:uncharacterized protein MICPUCDRAFT_53512 [Micromonas pusilla CCMP1545]|uniref:Predicted protein n=1 Tax=Micromonas pusilla (strain CCMP1545) TaxID=564608 RepID=C1N710_MICPC|nr:uncharacterized protein MICPUCDRAFT_53512 [Micromonas pusilla CCMP1545]EEH52198.1 predicted protein [Micromonas pusilla CCMP1545]|tara:strand:+ start:93 stop:1343 length:1251 start_codon:yes stop_codon:yes gene_type:complete|eukprot:XP_003063825.1 predicted protein [Micromonas pusilla CCMP1545]
MATPMKTLHRVATTATTRRAPRAPTTTPARRPRPRRRLSSRSGSDRDASSAARAAPNDASSSSTTLAPLPQTCAEQVAACASCVVAAAASGARRQRLTLLLPTNNRGDDFTSTERADYEANADAVYRAAMETAAAVMRRVDANGGDITATRVDDDNDPVGVLRNAAGSVRAVVIPNAQQLDVLRKLAEESERGRDAGDAAITLLVNPQWNESGQIISDFGVGPWKRRAFDFLDTFAPAFHLTETRVGAASTRDPAKGGDYMGTGGVARILKTHGGAWQVFAMGGDGSSECVRVEESEPTYEYLNAEVFVTPEYSLARRRRGAGPSMERRLEASARSVSASADDDDVAVDWSIASSAEIAAAVRVKAIRARDVDAFDKTGLRSALTALGLPTSGKVEGLRERLREALLGEDAEEWIN